MLQHNMSEKKAKSTSKKIPQLKGSSTAAHVDHEREVIRQFCQTQAAYIF